jgi:hypothetical protein
MLYFIAWAVRGRSVGVGWRQMYVRTGGRVVSKSTRAYKEGEGSVFAIFCVRTKWTTPYWESSAKL